MIPGAFQYHLAGSLPEALHMLAEHGDDAKILAGGQSLIPLMRFRLSQPEHLIDINRVPGLAGITESDGWLRIGALTRETAIERSAVVRERFPLLAETADVVADPLVRNLATLGGNLAHADPANDHPATMLAYRAVIIVTGANGEREIPIDDFFVDAFMPALEPGEILTEIRIPSPGPRSGGAYEKFERKVGDYAVAAAAVQLSLNEDGTVAQAGISTTNVTFVPVRISTAEDALVGQTPDEATLARIAGLAAEAADPNGDLRGSAEYKRAMARTVTLRALRRAVERARAN
jgi:aerobic carbon-monoxide dehydrogenase medium subunit